jgi:GTPase
LVPIPTLSILGNKYLRGYLIGSLLGVCTHVELDNGRGRARLNLFRYLHEFQTRRTSSITHEILGFNDLGEV